MDRPRYDRGPQVFQTCAMTTSANDPIYYTILIYFNYFIINILIEKSLFKLLYEGRVGFEPTMYNTDFADLPFQPLAHLPKIKNLLLYFFLTLPVTRNNHGY